jgi:hypothetical protein
MLYLFGSAAFLAATMITGAILWLTINTLGSTPSGRPLLVVILFTFCGFATLFIYFLARALVCA